MQSEDSLHYIYDAIEVTLLNNKSYCYFLNSSQELVMKFYKMYWLISLDLENKRYLYDTHCDDINKVWNAMRQQSLFTSFWKIIKQKRYGVWDIISGGRNIICEFMHI